MVEEMIYKILLPSTFKSGTGTGTHTGTFLILKKPLCV